MEVPRFKTYVEEVAEHSCDLNTRLYLELAVFGTEHPTGIERFWRALRLVSVVSPRHPYTKSMFRSTASLAAEVVRHMETAPNVIHPYSLFRSNYEIYMFFMYVLFAIWMPLYVTWYSCKNIHNYIFLVLLLPFWIDIAVNFCTGYVDKKQFVAVLDTKMIAKRYMLSYFIIDITSSIPYTFMIFCLRDFESFSKYYWIDVIFVLKIFRLPTIYAYYKQMAYRMGCNMVTRQAVRTAVSLLLYLHWVACVCIVASDVTEKSSLYQSNYRNTTETSLWSNLFNKHVLEVSWRNAMLRAITLTFACGFRIIFTEFADMLVNIIFFLVGVVIVVLIAVRVVVVARTLQMRGAQFETLWTHLVEYMRHKQVPEELESRLIEYYRFCFEHTYFHEPAILNFLSGQLQKDVLLQKGRLMMEATDVFDDVPPATMVRLVAGLRTIVVLPGDEVMRVGDPADRLMYVASGTLAVYDLEDNELCHLRDGQLFGEQSFVADREVIGVTIVALEATELWELSKSHFMAVTRAASLGPGRRGDQVTIPTNIFDKLRRRTSVSTQVAQRIAAAAADAARKRVGGARGRGRARGARQGGVRPALARPRGVRQAGVRPGVVRPGVARPGVARPGAARPGAARPGPARPGPARPGGARPGAARPGPPRPGGARPGAARPGGARPGAARPGAARPGPPRPGGAGPGGVQPGGARPGPVRPGGARPGGVQPGGARPGLARPGGARPGGVQPGGARGRGPQA